MNTSRPGEPTIDRPGWTGPARRMGIASAGGVTVIGVCYLAVIASWLVIERAPGEPIGDPYLAVMEVLTIASAFSILGLVVAIRCFADPLHRTHALVAFGLGVLASGTTMAVHFINLTAVRQAWRAGEIADYRLIWPSPLFAVEYFAWDVLIGTMMIAAGLAIGGHGDAHRARVVFVAGGVFCLIGVAGPVTGHMFLQNVAVVGYAVVLPVASAIAIGVFRGERIRYLGTG